MPESRKLFHYTTAEGLVGILQSKTLFASHYSFLNDRTEGQSLRDFAHAHLEEETKKFVPQLIQEGVIKAELLVEGGPGYYRAEVERMFRSMDRATDSVAPYFITSFCIHDKSTSAYSNGLLSQWRGYGRGGFAIEFDENAMDALAEKERQKWAYQGILSDAVHYRNFGDYVDLKDFDGFAATMFKEVLLEMLPGAKKRLEKVLGTKTINDFGQAYLSKVPFLKNAGFEEEREYRLAALCNRINFKEEGDTRDHKQIHFRTLGDGRITPYIKLFEGLTDQLPIKSIIVGPHPHQQSQLDAVQIMISQFGFDAELRASNIPFRD